MNKNAKLMLAVALTATLSSALTAAMMIFLRPAITPADEKRIADKANQQMIDAMDRVLQERTAEREKQK